MDNKLNITLRDILFFLDLATIYLDNEKREQVFQLFCAEMEPQVSEELLRKAMKDFGYTKQDKCMDCNELVEDGDHILCGRCHLEKTNPSY